jgi:DNA-binding PadR family transcriptional regulator
MKYDNLDDVDDFEINDILEMSEQEVDEALQDLLRKGLVEITGVKNDKIMYRVTQLGKTYYEHMTTDPKTRN